MAYKRDYNSDVEENQQSRINAAGLINSTLERLWMESYVSMANGDFIKWNSKLDSIWCILGGDVPEKDPDNNFINKIDLQIYETGTLKEKTGIGFDKKTNPNRALQYQLLKKKSLFLRRLQNKQGKGTAYRSDDYEDFD